MSLHYIEPPLRKKIHVHIVSNGLKRSLLLGFRVATLPTLHVLDCLEYFRSIASVALVMHPASWNGGPEFESWVELGIRTITVGEMVTGTAYAFHSPLKAIHQIQIINLSTGKPYRQNLKRPSSVSGIGPRGHMLNALGERQAGTPTSRCGPRPSGRPVEEVGVQLTRNVCDPLRKRNCEVFAKCRACAARTSEALTLLSGMTQLGARWGVPSHTLLVLTA